MTVYVFYAKVAIRVEADTFDDAKIKAKNHVIRDDMVKRSSGIVYEYESYTNVDNVSHHPTLDA